MTAIEKIMNDIRGKKTAMHDYAYQLTQAKNNKAKMYFAELVANMYQEISIAESLIGEVK